MREFYKTTIVQIGFACDYIMRGILALSSLHLAHNRQHMQDQYKVIAIMHNRTASQAVLPLVASSPTSEDAQRFFLFSILTSYYCD
jgi:hypothetical protein